MKITPNKKLNFPIIVIVVILLLFFLHYIKVLKPIENLAIRVMTPFQKNFYQVSDSINGWFENTKSKNELVTENTNLKEQLTQSLIDQAKFLELQEENDFYRKQLNIDTTNDYSKVVGHVISKSLDERIKTITLNIGSKQGVIVGTPIIVEEGIIAGKVIKVTNYNAVVLLVNDHISQLACTVLNNDKTIGLVKGEYGLGVKMELIPQIENIKPGDIVITSGMEELIPRGLVLGTVDSIIGSEEDIFKQAVIKTPYDLNKIYNVTAIIQTQYDN